MADDAVLLTGATGFLGQALLQRLATARRPVVALVRADDDDGARARLLATLEALVGPDAAAGAPVRALAADLATMDPAAVAARLAQDGTEIGEVVHSAACVRFDLPLEDARRVNVGGTARMLELARLLHARRPLRRHAQVSTAFVAGDHVGRFGEDDAWVGQNFRNSYERSKLEAESLVRAREHELPVQILRPSIVVGERGSGWTASFNVFYVPLRALASGALRALPRLGGGRADLVPVDFVADGVLALADAPAGPRATYHLTADEHAMAVDDLVTLTCERTGQAPAERVPPDQLAEHLGDGVAARLLRAHLSDYLPYLDVRATFDAARARAWLRPRGISASPLEDYLDDLLRFASACRWGRAMRSRRQALAAA